jgi:hypothetical protein
MTRQSLWRYLNTYKNYIIAEKKLSVCFYDNSPAERVTAADVPFLVEFLKDHPQIRDVDLSGNNIGDKGAESLAALPLEQLALNKSDVGAIGMEAIAKSSLKGLICDQNNFNAGASFLAGSRMDYLSVYGDVGGEQLQAFAKTARMPLVRINSDWLSIKCINSINSIKEGIVALGTNPAMINLHFSCLLDYQDVNCLKDVISEAVTKATERKENAERICDYMAAGGALDSQDRRYLPAVDSYMRMAAYGSKDNNRWAIDRESPKTVQNALTLKQKVGEICDYLLTGETVKEGDERYLPFVNEYRKSCGLSKDTYKAFQETQYGAGPFLPKLPTEKCIQIVSYLSEEDRHNVSEVCRSAYGVAATVGKDEDRKSTYYQDLIKNQQSSGLNR